MHNERRITCRNYDRSFRGRFQWRFNGSSVFPSYTKTAREQLIFLNGSNAKRRQLVGTYDCCVKENIGDGCYRTRLVLKDAVQTIGLNVENTSEVIAVEGNSYFLRLFPSKKRKSIICTHNGNATLPENIVFNTKGAHQQKKFHDFYQMKISDIDATNAGKYICESTVLDKGPLRKVFTVLVEKEKRISLMTRQPNRKSCSLPIRPTLATFLITCFLQCLFSVN
ncbi:Uncharacterized protein Tcan_03802 [Toxocara canis]|uniref:Uncharacterized protein n=1 Tax=Toxocara canis TaxID=6265 RepID=A0A0B2VV36_TOXCA|nr:Uncharacterized protein Tcan_03802 [Toxocara canis]